MEGNEIWRAVQQGDRLLLEGAVANGHDVDGRRVGMNRDGSPVLVECNRSPLQQALQNQRFDLARCLLEAGCSCQDSTLPENIKMTSTLHPQKGGFFDGQEAGFNRNQGIYSTKI